jgi:predicted RNase H-like HicB family nuclease
MNTETITFVITEDAADGGYVAQAHWASGNRHIQTQGDDRDELVRNIREAIEASFGEGEEKPEIVHLHFVHDETFPLVASANDKDRYPLRGESYQFDDPYSPVATEDWEAVK